MATLKTDAFDYEGEEEWEDEEPYVKTTSDALHCACYNQRCPNTIVELLLKEYQSAAEWLSLVEEGVNGSIKGLPLHYYLEQNYNLGTRV